MLVRGAPDRRRWRGRPTPWAAGLLYALLTLLLVAAGPAGIPRNGAAVAPLQVPPAGATGWTAAGLEGRYVRALAADPTRPGRLYAGAGLPRPPLLGGATNFAVSEDDGSTWTPGVLAHGTLIVLDLAAAADGALYAAMRGAGVMKSLDGGTTWAVQTQGLGPLTSEPPAVAVQPTNPAAVYAVFGIAGAGVSDDGGVTWGLYPVPMRCVLSTVAAAPAPPATVWVGGGCGVLTSEDGGATWRGPTGPALSTDLAVHPIAPRRLLAASTQQGLWGSADGGTTWAPVAGAGSRVDRVRFVPTDPRGRTIVAAGSPRYGGTGVWLSRDGGGTWVPLGFPETAREALALLLVGDRVLLGTENGLWAHALSIGLPRTGGGPGKRAAGTPPA
jgi:hypothetical protein